MKLQPDQFDVQSISGYGPGWVGVGSEKITQSVILSSGGERIDWGPRRFEDLEPAHFERLAAIEAEVVIFGSGQRIRFPQANWLQPLMARRIGVEINVPDLSLSSCAVPCLISIALRPEHEDQSASLATFAR